MEKRKGNRPRGLQRKTVILTLAMLLITVAVLSIVSEYQSRMLVRIVGETRTEQEQAISGVSEETMHRILTETLVSNTVLRAGIADSDFAEVVNDTYMLQSMAQGLLENRNSLDPVTYQLPDPALDGTPSAMVLYTDGVVEAADPDKRMFGTDRMLEALNAEKDASPQKILENVGKAVDVFANGAEQFDDLTMLCIEYRGSGGASAEA